MDLSVQPMATPGPGPIVVVRVFQPWFQPRFRLQARWVDMPPAWGVLWRFFALLAFLQCLSGYGSVAGAQATGLSGTAL